MRFREVKIRPIQGTVALDGKARVYRTTGESDSFAVLRGGCFGGDRAEARALCESLRGKGFKGTIIGLSSTEEFTLCEVDDGSPARWQEDGRPSYADLEKRVKELESVLAMGSGADCAPCTVRP